MLSWILPALLVTTLVHPETGETLPYEAVVPAERIGDPVFAYLVGLVDADLYGTLDAAVLDDVVARSGARTELPYGKLLALSRRPGDVPSRQRIEATFADPLQLPIPYSILGYNPGRVRGTRTVVFHEYDLGEFVFRHTEDGAARDVRVTGVHLFGVRTGWMVIDVDGFVDWILGGKLDDTRVTGLVLFDYDSERWGMAVGYNADGRGRSGVLSLRRNRIRFPTPPELKTAAWKLRQILESYEPALRPDSLRARGGICAP
ncbi:MAG: hypothetical protein GF346_11830 [Candidatus Eisenbacteria bacterium]|nr:hypothetical protein [Candidatus Latescibacterota bacterium]MBD3303126.1 hypothetical protein [Candidatus Eisenbacteria bacterium]